MLEAVGITIQRPQALRLLTASATLAGAWLSLSVFRASPGRFLNYSVHTVSGRYLLEEQPLRRLEAEMLAPSIGSEPSFLHCDRWLPLS
jgi:hypothetical protein